MPDKIKVDLHDIFNKSDAIEAALRRAMEEAVRIKAREIEIIPGKGSGELKKHVIRFLETEEMRKLYHRLEKDSKNFGRIFVHFRWK